MNAPVRRTTADRLRKAVRDPRSILIKILQKGIDSLRGYSYDFHKNGEKELLSKLAALNPSVVFDVGCNVGEWSQTAIRHFPNARIHCFELSDSTFKTLSENLKGPNFVLNNMGMGDKDAVVEYKDYGDNSKVNTLLVDATYHDRKIEFKMKRSTIRSGDSYCAEKGIEAIDFLKIDVEGADHLVLEGFSGLLQKKAVRVIQFEYGYTHGDAKFLMRDFHRLFAQHGYVVGRVQKGGIEFEDWNYKQNDFRSGPNYVAVRADDADLITRLKQR
ncbi:FkbM family methyltransferase [Hydrogenophaga sp.]|uniref:FkbM family methyltransferase n=1 Tax=Hydrogenophaga sp. TaxID=1904254 RepID=UPI003D0ED46F